MNKQLTRREFLKIAAAGTAFLSLPNCTLKQSVNGSKKKPNIILVVADDLGYRNLGCYGQQKIKTPALDQLAANGMKFNRFYAGNALCLPSRVSLMTGLHSGHSRVRENGGGGVHPPIHEEDTTIATVLKAAGYKTGMTGKWSLGDHFIGCVHEEQNTDGSGAVYKHGWDYYFGEPNQTYNHNYYPEQLYRYDPNGWIGAKTEGKRLDPVRYPENERKHTHYSHDEITKNALAFIDNVKSDHFFLYVPYTIPHADFVVPELEEYTKNKSWEDNAKVFASMISRMDRDCGRIVDKLKEHGIEKDTLFIFTSDNGGLKDFDDEFDNNGELEGYKVDLSEGGLRVPCIAYWPGKIKAGAVSDELLAFWDFMPTFAELADINPPAPIDGLSFAPTLTGKGKQTEHKYLFFNMDDKNQYIVRGEGENRNDEAIIAEALTDVVVPRFSQ
ncbi:sulfatase-like hydrolase/transferase [candidate division KSB1 bacterium]|nr:sulfatase-like hydrolase/transferase [candidate division KSB1 bacterium]